MRKGTDGAQIVTVLSNLGASGRSYTLSLSGTGYPAGQQLTEVYSCATVTVDSDGKVPVHMANGLPRVFYPTAGLNRSTICT
jgi:alpha-amylase